MDEGTDDDDLTISRTPSLTQLVAEKIADAIARGQFPAGARLVETDLAARFKVSRGPIREALKLVAGDGLVQMTAGRGTFVIQPSAQDLEHMILVRALLEGCAARLFVLGSHADALQRLRAIVAEMHGATERQDVDVFRELHWRFHETVCGSADNGFLLRAWAALRSTYRVFVRLHLGSRADMASVLGTHAQLLAALQGADAGAAEAAERCFRSLIIRGGYAILGREVPAGLRSYLA